MPSFRILAPEFICGQTKPENISDTGSAAPQQITIGLSFLHKTNLLILIVQQLFATHALCSSLSIF